MTSFPDRAGLQPERTALAWQRTAVTSLVLLAPVVVVDIRMGRWWLAALSSLAMIAGSVLVLGVRHRFRQLHDDDTGYSPFPHLARVAAVTVLGAAGGLATGLALLWS